VLAGERTAELDREVEEFDCAGLKGRDVCRDAFAMRYRGQNTLEITQRYLGTLVTTSGGPPTPTTSAISSKQLGPKRPGLIIARKRASSSPLLSNAWTTPR
jgi:hypothetical protein